MENERGERGGFVLDGPEDDVNADQSKGDESDASLATIEETDDAELEQSGETNLERGEEDTETRGDGSGEESEIPKNGSEPGTDDKTVIKTIQQQLKEVHDKLNAPKPEETKQLSEEDWAKLEQEWGSPRSTIERITQQSVKVVNHLQSYIDSKFAKLEFAQTLSDFSKQPGFQDAGRYKKEVTEFMQAYEPRHWSNADIIKKAVYYARGINADKNINRARNDGERNRVIVGRARPSSPSGGQRKTSLPPLSPTQKAAAALMDGGEAEYNKFRLNGGRVVLEA